MSDLAPPLRRALVFSSSLSRINTGSSKREAELRCFGEWEDHESLCFFVFFWLERALPEPFEAEWPSRRFR